MRIRWSITLSADMEWDREKLLRVLKQAVLTYGNMVIYNWSVVTVDGRRYTVDPCLDIFEPEESEYSHPAVDYLISIYG